MTTTTPDVGSDPQWERRDKMLDRIVVVHTGVGPNSTFEVYDAVVDATLVTLDRLTPPAERLP